MRFIPQIGDPLDTRCLPVLYVTHMTKHDRRPNPSQPRFPTAHWLAWLKLSGKAVRSVAMPLVGIGLALGMAALPGRANDPASAPPQLKEVLTRLDAAATSRDLPQVMQFYASNFVHSDGLTRQQLEQVLTQLWQEYPRLNYRTELVSWRQEGSAWVVETITRIDGIRQVEGRNLRLQATLRSQQRISDRQVTQQNILAERTQVLSGENPPTVTVKLPERVTVGQQYNFDAIVQEPLGKDFLLGAVTEEPVRADRYLSPAPANLVPLAAGGIFRIGRAPRVKSDRWISAVLIRQGGITVVTQRLRVTDR